LDALKAKEVICLPVVQWLSQAKSRITVRVKLVLSGFDEYSYINQMSLGSLQKKVLKSLHQHSRDLVLHPDDKHALKIKARNIVLCYRLGIPFSLIHQTINNSKKHGQWAKVLSKHPN
jgi:hypothetical protein